MHSHGETDTVELWFQALPLSDPRCANDSCEAFKAAHDASQAEISWASQFNYGLYTTWFYIAIIAIFTFFHMYSLVSAQRMLKNNTQESKPSIFDKIVALTRAFSYRRLAGNVGLYLALPSFGVLLLVFISFIGAAALSFAQRPYYRGNRGYGSPPLAVRTGLMASALTPLIVALAGKINLVTMLTGYGHEKLNSLHRYVAWLMVVLSIIHTIPFIVAPLKDGGAQALREKYYEPGSLEYNGTPTFAIAIFLTIFSLPIFRKWAYELFVHSHYIAAVVYLGLCFWHFGNLGGSWHYLWATLGVWLVSLLGRVFWKTSVFRLTDSWLEGCPTILFKMPGDMLKLRVLVPLSWQWHPGQHVFLRFPTLHVFDNHPFTIASIPAYRAAGSSSHIQLHRGSNGKTMPPDTHHSLDFIIRPRTGFTGKLLSRASADPDATFTTIVDGPYGTAIHGLDRMYDEVVLVAGGGGITACLTWLLHLSQCMRHAGVTTVTKHVRLLWMVKTADAVGWVEEELSQTSQELPPGRLVLDVYVTQQSQTAVEKVSRRQSSDQPASPATSIVVARKAGIGTMKENEDTCQRHSIINMHFEGRPDVPALLQRTDVIRGPRTAVIGCGPESLKIDLSNAIARRQKDVLEGKLKDLMLHTETFDW